MIVYLDTISINKLFEELDRRIGLKSLKKYLPHFKSVIQVPIYVIGLDL